MFAEAKRSVREVADGNGDEVPCLSERGWKRFGVELEVKLDVEGGGCGFEGGGKSSARR